MKWALKVERGKRKGMLISIHKSPFLIGRNGDCHLRAANPYVSHHHCELLAEDDKMIVRDCKSTNGTFINAQRVEDQVELHEGDSLKIGSLSFVVCHEDAQTDKPQAPEPVPPKPSSRAVDEEVVGDILLKLDEEEEDSTGPPPGAWRNNSFPSGMGKGANPDRPNPDRSKPDNKPTIVPSDVASDMLKGQEAALKRRS